MLPFPVYFVYVILCYIAAPSRSPLRGLPSLVCDRPLGSFPKASAKVQPLFELTKYSCKKFSGQRNISFTTLCYSLQSAKKKFFKIFSPSLADIRQKHLNVLKCWEDLSAQKIAQSRHSGGHFQGRLI
jgi:hypothetical protein